MNKNKAVKGAIFLIGVYVGTHIQSAAMRYRLQRAVNRAYASCQTAQDLVNVDNVFESMKANRPT